VIIGVINHFNCRSFNRSCFFSWLLRSRWLFRLCL